MRLEFSIYRYNPDVDDAPRMQDYTLEAEEGRDMMLLDALIQLKEKDPSLSFRRSCREGVCGSDGLNMNGKNGLACITPISALNQPGKKIVIRPLPGLPVIRDLVVDRLPNADRSSQRQLVLRPERRAQAGKSRLARSEGFLEAVLSDSPPQITQINTERNHFLGGYP